jgi:hypothetical protein
MIQFSAAEICEKKGKVPSRDLNSEKAAPFSFETEHIWRAAAAGFSFTKRLDEICSYKSGNNLGYSWCAETGCANKIGSRARPGFAQQLQDGERIGMAKEGGPADLISFFLHLGSLERRSIGAVCG